MDSLELVTAVGLSSAVAGAGLKTLIDWWFQEKSRQLAVRADRREEARLALEQAEHQYIRPPTPAEVAKYGHKARRSSPSIVVTLIVVAFAIAGVAASASWLASEELRAEHQRLQQELADKEALLLEAARRIEQVKREVSREQNAAPDDAHAPDAESAAPEEQKSPAKAH